MNKGIVNDVWRVVPEFAQNDNYFSMAVTFSEYKIKCDLHSWTTDWIEVCKSMDQSGLFANQYKTNMENNNA